MNSRLSILAIAALALLLGAPKVARSSESLTHLATNQPVVKPLPISAFQSPEPGTIARQLPAEEDLGKKFVLIVKLSDQQINRLRLTGSLSTRIPPKFVNRVGAIRFKRTSSFRGDALKVSGAKTEKSNRSMSVEIDNSVLERLAYQPVDLRIYESGFDVVELKFNPLGIVAGELPEEFQPSVDQGQAPYMYARINSQRGIYGSLENFETLAIKTQFGKVSVPSAEIAGIRFNDGSANRAFVVLKKGDVFSGEIELDSIAVKSRWGDQTLKLTELESLTLNREVIFLRDAINPKRWQLRTSLPVTSRQGSAQQNQDSPRPVLPSSNQINPFQLNQNQLNQNPPVVSPYAPFGFPN